MYNNSIFFPCKNSLRGTITLFLLLLIFPPAISQSTWSTTNCPKSGKEAYIWYFGNYAGLHFTDDLQKPELLTNQNVMKAAKGTAIICDSMGNLLFFSDGTRVWDRNFTLMPNATNLAGDQSSTQPALIVPWPGDSSKYYLFTIKSFKPNPPGPVLPCEFRVTIIDMKERNGLGDALSTVLNKELLIPSTTKLTAVKHKNGKDYWVVAHKWLTNEFYSYHLTPAGMAPPVVSAAGSDHGDLNTDYNSALGYMKFSPDGRRIATAIMSAKKIELFDFNDETGQISNPLSFNTTIPGIEPYGLEFSPDCKKLYATLAQPGGTGEPARPSYILQFNLDNGLTAPVTVDSLIGIRNLGIQLGPDGRIYIARTVSGNQNELLDSLEVIYNPNRIGVKCNLNLIQGVPKSGISLGGKKSVYCMPNFVQSFVNVPPFKWDSVCHGNITKFTITNKVNIDSVNWSFGDGAFSGSQDAFHQYSNPGKYSVRLTEYYNGDAFIDSMQVTNYKLPEIGLADTVLLYTGSSINLHAGGGNMEYFWSNTSRDSIISVSSEGNYTVRVKDYHCCINSDTTYVKVFAYSIPNAFTPNGDGLNDIFRVSGLYRNIDFNMIVYDRWGRMLFESKDIDKGWNGTYNGVICPSDAYIWMVNVKFRGEDIITTGDVKFKGTVTLVR